MRRIAWLRGIVFALALVAGCGDSEVVLETEPEPDVVGELVEVALMAHEEATGSIRPERVVLGSWRGLDEGLPHEIADEVRRRIESGSGASVAVQDADEQPAGWTVYFSVAPDVADIVLVEVRELGRHVWPVYGVSVTRTADGFEVGKVVVRGEVLTQVSPGPGALR